MTDVIQYAIQYLYDRIPSEILQLTFSTNNGIPYNHIRSIDDAIDQQVIQRRVIKDCSLVSGKIKYITLLSQYLEIPKPDNFALTNMLGQFSIYRIPPEAREGCPISSVMSLSYPARNSAAMFPNQQNADCPYVTMNQMANEVLQSQTMSNSRPTPTPELVGSNIIRLIPSQFVHLDWVVACKLAFDGNMTNATHSSILPFAKLVLYATQMYIYNDLIVKLDQGFIQGGAEIGAIKNIIESYQDANEKYDEELLHFRGGATLDTKNKMIILSHML